MECRMRGWLPVAILCRYLSGSPNTVNPPLALHSSMMIALQCTPWANLPLSFWVTHKGNRTRPGDVFATGTTINRRRETSNPPPDVASGFWSEVVLQPKEGLTEAALQSWLVTKELLEGRAVQPPRRALLPLAVAVPVRLVCPCIIKMKKAYQCSLKVGLLEADVAT